MGKVDRLEKVYMSSNERFADLFNYYLFHGRQVIRAGDLTERNISELAFVTGKGKKPEVYERFRDLMRSCVIKQTDYAVFMLLGLENQEEVHYAMPVRHMLSDALNYASQVERHKKRHRRRKDLRNPGEFLSGMTSKDKLIPVITLTLYWGSEIWDAPRTLHEMFDVPDKELLEFVGDYKANLLIPSEMDDMGLFRSDLGKVLAGIRVKDDKKALVSLMESDEAFFSDLEPEVAALLEYHTNVIIRAEEVEEGKEDGMKVVRKKLDLCKAVKDLVQDGFEQGEVVGAIKAYHNEGLTDEEIVKKVRSMFKLTSKQVKDYMKKAIVTA